MQVAWFFVSLFASWMNKNNLFKCIIRKNYIHEIVIPWNVIYQLSTNVECHAMYTKKLNTIYFVKWKHNFTCRCNWHSWHWGSYSVLSSAASEIINVDCTARHLVQLIKLLRWRKRSESSKPCLHKLERTYKDISIHVMTV